MSIKLKITKTRVFLLFVVLLVSFYFLLNPPEFPVYYINFKGKPLRFRVDLREAYEIPVYPSEEDVRNFLLNPTVENITIYFIPGSGEENAHAAIEVFEITYKLSVIYSRTFGYIPNFNVLNVTSYEGLSGSAENPAIAIVHPLHSNKTCVELVNGTVFVYGANSTSERKRLRNLDLATAKMIITTVGIKY